MDSEKVSMAVEVSSQRVVSHRKVSQPVVDKIDVTVAVPCEVKPRLRSNPISSTVILPVGLENSISACSVHWNSKRFLVTGYKPVFRVDTNATP